MLKTRIAFFGSAGWKLTNIHLKRFIERKANIVVFVRSSADKVKSTVQKTNTRESMEHAAKRLGIPLLSRENIKTKEFQEEFLRYKPDAAIVCGYQLYIPRSIRDIVPIGIINFHSSLLPRHAGMHPGFWTIWYGDKISGMTVHFMDDGIDTGDILYVSKVQVKNEDSIESLYERIWESSTPLVDRLLYDLDKETLPRTSQDYSKYIYNYEITDKDFELDFRQPAEILAGRVSMLPGRFYVVLNNEKYFLDDCRAVDESVNTRKFKINKPYFIDRKVVYVTPRQYLEIKKVHKDGADFKPVDLLRIIES